MSTELHCDICNDRITRVPVFQIIRPKLYKIGNFNVKTEFDICSKCWNKILKEIKEKKE